MLSKYYYRKWRVTVCLSVFPSVCVRIQYLNTEEPSAIRILAQLLICCAASDLTVEKALLTYYSYHNHYRDCCCYYYHDYYHKWSYWLRIDFFLPIQNLTQHISSHLLTGPYATALNNSGLQVMRSQ